MGSEDMALVLSHRLDTPGVKLICRQFYEMQAAGHGKPLRLSAEQQIRRKRCCFGFLIGL